MNVTTREQQRNLAAKRRGKPGRVLIVRIPFDGTNDWEPQQSSPPTEIHLESTGASGETAVWLDDHFWMSLIQLWAQETIAVHFLATPGSLTNPVVRHQLNMLRRVVPNWRLIGHCYASDLTEDGVLSQAALGSHHELRLSDAHRPGMQVSGHPLKIQDIAARIRKIQAANNRTTPIVTCCRADQPTSAVIEQEVSRQATGNTEAPVSL